MAKDNSFLPADRASGRRPQGRPVSIGPEVLVAAVCELLQHLRPDKITIARVAREARVDPKLIHYYFGDRAGLLSAAAESLSARFQADVASVSGATAADRLQSRIAAFLRFQKANPYFHRLMIEEILPSPDGQAHSALRQVSARGIDAYRRILGDGLTEGTMRAIDVPQFYLALIGMVEMLCVGEAILREAGHEPVAAEDFAERTSAFLTDLLVNGLRAT